MKKEYGEIMSVYMQISMNNRMRNIDRLLHLTLRELAPYFVKDETKEYADPCFTSPSRGRFWT